MKMKRMMKMKKCYKTPIAAVYIIDDVITTSGVKKANKRKEETSDHFDWDNIGEWIPNV